MYRDLRTIEFEARAVFTTMTKMRSKIEGFSRDSRLEFVHQLLVLSYFRTFQGQKDWEWNLRGKFARKKNNLIALINFLDSKRIEREMIIICIHDFCPSVCSTKEKRKIANLN